jgi:hypothetical protein
MEGTVFPASSRPKMRIWYCTYDRVRTRAYECEGMKRVEEGRSRRDVVCGEGTIHFACVYVQV